MKITICGSARWADEVDGANVRLSLQGHVVYSIVPCLREPSPEQKIVLRRIHRQKIDASDAIFVVSVDGHVGEDTSAEIEYARSSGKTVLMEQDHG